MNIPQEYKDIFKQAIKDTFCDKEVIIFKQDGDESQDEYAETIEGDLIKLATIKCNARDINNEIMLKEYGYTVDADISITFSEIKDKSGKDIDIEKESAENILIVQYKGNNYQVKKILSPDSHYDIFAKKV